MHMRDMGVIGDKAMITTEGFYMGETWRSTIATGLASCRSGSIPRRARRMPCLSARGMGDLGGFSELH